MTLSPAYGRDYKSKKEILQSLADGKDFVIADISSPWDGSYVNAPQLIAAGKFSVNVRYKQLRSVCVVDLRKLPAANPGAVGL